MRAFWISADGLSSDECHHLTMGTIISFNQHFQHRDHSTHLLFYPHAGSLFTTAQVQLFYVLSSVLGKDASQSLAS